MLNTLPSLRKAVLPACVRNRYGGKADAQTPACFSNNAQKIQRNTQNARPHPQGADLHSGDGGDLAWFCGSQLRE